MKKISAETLNEQVYNELRRVIMSGYFEPGERLTVRKLVDALGTSQMPIRVALNRLVAEGALSQSETNGSSLIRSPTLEQVTDWMDLRAVLEERAARQSVANLTTSAIDRLDRILLKLEDCQKSQNTKKHLEQNFAFKHLLYSGCQSQTLLRFIDMLWLRVGPFLRVLSFDVFPEVFEPQFERQIIADLKQGTLDRIGDMVHDEIISTKNLIIERADLLT